MKVGASYYPELSTREIWEEDLATAKQTGLSVLRCGEFAWSRISRREGEWDLSWAHEFLDVALEQGFSVIWCTPSATPPPYLFDRWPSLQATTEKNHPVPVGIRRNYCPSHHEYRELCSEVATRLAEEFRGHGAIVGWQVDNELAGDGFTCWCENCRKSFHRWLEERYGSLDALADAWKTDLWSQRYTDWSQIPIPHQAFAAAHTPALKLAWRRFRSDNWLAFYQAQANALRGAKVGVPVTTNFYNLSWDIPFDRWNFRPHLDAVGISHYLEDEVASKFELALLRGLDRKPLWVLEQKAGQQNAQNLYPEDLSRLQKHLEICSEAGAEYAIYWHLRQHQAGCEMEHGAVLRHDGKPTRVARRIREAIASLPAENPIPTPPNLVLVFDFHQQWAQENRPQPGTAWVYRCVLEQDWFGALNDLGRNAAIASTEDALRQARVVLAPHLQLAPGEDRIRMFLEQGGTFITTADFGRLDQENNVRPLAPLEGLAFGKDWPDGEMLHLKEDFQVRGNCGSHPLSGGKFWFVPSSGGASREDGLVHGEFAGPAYLERNVGSGKVIVLLSAFDRESLVVLLRRLLA